MPATVAFKDSGVIRGMYQATQPIEIWKLDDDVPPLIGPCEDTDGQDGPWLTGGANLKANNNDLTGEPFEILRPTTQPFAVSCDRPNAALAVGVGSPFGSEPCEREEPGMPRRFGERINQFVLSIDLLDEDAFFDLLDLISEYVQQHLGITYLSVLVETQIDEWQGLRTLWTSREQAPSYIVDQGTGTGYRSHSAYTFGKNVPIWVVSDSKQPLADANDLVDEWSKSPDLPAYHSKDQNVRTSVMHPLRRDGAPVGVVEFASDEYVKPTPPSLDEVATLAQVISRAFRLYDVRQLQQANTREALKMLEDDLTAQSWARLAMPQLFVAYAGGDPDSEAHADHKALIDRMRAVIAEFDDHLAVTYWEDATESGNIMEQVIRDIGESEYGICYLSEPSGPSKWDDNSNVLFEAGMMQALTRSPNTPLRGWIPIREGSPNIPFDIAAERMLVPPRTGGSLDADAFDRMLRQRLARLIEIEHHDAADTEDERSKPEAPPTEMDAAASVTALPTKSGPSA